MIALILIPLITVFVLGSIAPLCITEEMHDIVQTGR
jgi:hypothetical protein